MKTIYKEIFIFSVALFAQNMMAQKATISGTVTDSQSPLPGATIILSNNQKTTTDFSGYFTIQDVRSGSLELQIAYIGYETKNIKIEVKDNQHVSLGIIRLETNSKELSEVVVSGMSQRNSEARALNMQKKSMSIVNVIAADGIGKNHKGAYAISFDANAKNTDMNDIYYGKYNSFDFSASYKVREHFTIFSDVNNVLNEPLMYHFGETPNRPKQVEYYGAKFNLGLKYNL